MSGVVARLGSGEPFTLVEGPDAICAALESPDADHCLEPRNRDRDAMAQRSVEIALGRALPSPMVLSAADLATLRSAFAAGTLRAPCAGCEWHSLCDDVSAAGFEGTELLAASNLARRG